MFETKLTTVPITKQMVKEAYRQVKANNGSAGVDKESLENFEADLLNNLYKLWNRLSSGSYFPKPVREVIIPKPNGGERRLGIPTVSDRIAQQVVKTFLEPRLEQEFHVHSYGYRPQKSAHDAVAEVYKNVRQRAWVVDIDIKSFFDEVDHDLLMKAVSMHVPEHWVKMYIDRWLQCPIQTADKRIIDKAGKGTPQGGVISPLLANLFLHYVLDKWLCKYFPNLKFVRYADDLIVHCRYEEEATQILELIRRRLQECKLELNESKTKIVYCQNEKLARNNYPKKFDFLGFTFKPRPFLKDKMFLGYSCAISIQAQSRIMTEWKRQGWYKNTVLTIQELSRWINEQMRGIIHYYGRFGKWALARLFWHLDFRIAKWVSKRYKKLKSSQKKVYRYLQQMKSSYPNMFYHWTLFN